MFAKIAIASLLATAALVAAAPVPNPDGGSAYTGAGGSAIGGNNADLSTSGPVSEGLANNGEILNALSGNGGDGGKATSGTAVGGDGGIGYSYENGKYTSYSTNGGSAYSGVGGNTNGGSVTDTNVNTGYPRPNGSAGGYWGWVDDAGALNNVEAGSVLSGNAGEGGDASSGNAIGGDAGGVRH